MKKVPPPPPVKTRRGKSAITSSTAVTNESKILPNLVMVHMKQKHKSVESIVETPSTPEEELHFAVKQEDVDGLRIILDRLGGGGESGGGGGPRFSSRKKLDLNAPDWENGGRAALLEAAAKQNNKLLCALLAAGCDANVRDCQGQNALHLALNHWRRDRLEDVAEIVGVLLDAGCDPDVREQVTGYLPLQLLVKHLLTQHGSTSPTSNGVSTVENGLADDCDDSGVKEEEAEEEDSPELRILDMLVKKCDVNKTNHRGKSTVLHLVAAGSGLTDAFTRSILRTLLKAGADPNVQNERGESPLIVAIDNSKQTVVRAILAECDANLQDRFQQTALHHATNKIDGNSGGVIRMLLGKGCDPNLADLNGDTALHLAAGKGHIDAIVALLDDSSTDVNIQNSQGKTPLYIAVESGFVEVIKELLKSNCDVCLKNKQSRKSVLELTEENNFRQNNPIISEIIAQAVLPPPTDKADVSRLEIK